MSHRLMCSIMAAAFFGISPSVFAQDEAIAEAVALDPIATAQVAEDGQAADEPRGDRIARSEPTVRPLTVSASLTDRSIITGTLLDSTSVAIRTAFGEASLPLSEVAGIRFPAADDTSTTVVMLNGDSITGATDLKFINVETTWGSAKINGQSIASMLFVPGLAWDATEGLGGRRWVLKEKTAPNAVQQQNPVQAASGTRPAPTNRNAYQGRTIGQQQQQLPTPAPQIIYGR
ncbi:MAG: hypothetical protein Aurels2KO_06010 [Aureliella sp.]